MDEKSDLQILKYVNTSFLRPKADDLTFKHTIQRGKC